MSRAPHSIALADALLETLVGERLCAEASLFELAAAQARLP